MADLLKPGFELMLLGMGIVFVFLSILIATLKAMSALVNRFDSLAAQEILVADAAIGRGAGAVSATHIAVITAAVARFRAAQRV